MSATKVVTWNGTASSSIPELVIGKVTRRMIGNVRGSYVSVAGREGAWFFPEKRGVREITMECFVAAESYPTDRRDAITAVADWLDVEVEAALSLSDEPGVYYMATLAETPSPDEWRELGTFEINFLAQPYSLDNTISSEVQSGDANFLFSFDPGLDIPVYPVIQITPNNGTIVDLEFGDLLFAGSIPNGQTLTINSISATVTSGVSVDVEVTGAYDPQNMVMNGVSGVFPTLVPGPNSFSVVNSAGTATDITVEMTYRKRYRK